jgi:lipopolysaccharide export system permease protein
MTLSLYVARRFVTSFALVFGAFFLILFLIQMIEEVRRLPDGETGIGRSAVLALLAAPESIYRILPLIVILATIALFLSLSRASELVVMRASGRSALRTLVAPVVTAAILGMLAVTVANPIAAATSKRYELMKSSLRLGEEAVLSVSREGLWLRQGGEGGQTVIHAARSNADGTSLSGVTLITISEDGTPARRVEAAGATLTAGAWKLTDAKDWRLDGSDNPEKGATAHQTLDVPSDLTPQQIRDSFGSASTIAVWDLPEFIASLERAGFSAVKHRVWLQMELALPLLFVSMVLIGAGFTLRHVRLGRTGVFVLAAIAAGFSIFFLRNFAQILGENGQIPVALAAWSPPVAATLLSVALLLHLEDG